MKIPKIYYVDEIKSWNYKENADECCFELARPLEPTLSFFHISSLWNRLKLAFMVFIGKYDVLNWRRLGLEALKLDLPAFRNYLLFNKWVLTNKINIDTDIYIFVKIIDGEEVEIVLPMSRRYADYEVRVVECLKIVSKVSGESIANIFKSIREVANVRDKKLF